MIFLASTRTLKDSAGAAGGFLIDAKDGFQAWSVAMYFAQRVLGLPAETAIDLQCVAASEGAVRCEVVRTLAHAMPPRRISPVTGLLKAQAAAASFDPLCIGVKINAVLPNARIELPLAVPVIDASDVRYIDATGAVRALGPIDQVDFAVDLPSMGMAAVPASQPRAPQIALLA